MGKLQQAMDELSDETIATEFLRRTIHPDKLDAKEKKLGTSMESLRYFAKCVSTVRQHHAVREKSSLPMYGFSPGERLCNTQAMGHVCKSASI